MKYYTTGQVAKLVGCSVSTIKNWCDKDLITYKTEKVGKYSKRLIPDKGVLEAKRQAELLDNDNNDIRDKISIEDAIKEAEVKDNKPIVNDTVQAINDHIYSLKEQLRVKDDQLKEKDKQINDLIESKKNSDILIKNFQNKLGIGTIENDKWVTEIEETKKTENKGFFKRLFS